MTNAFAETFRRDPSLFPQQLDIAGDRVLVAQMTRADYDAASFLDQRILSDGRQWEWRSWPELEVAGAGLPASADFIFHIGHVGSTLIARLLGTLEGVFALREPQLLRNFAELGIVRNLRESPWQPTLFGERLETALSWLSRTYGPHDRALIKATSFVSEIAGDIARSGRKSLVLTLSPTRYIETILGGENSRQELAMMSGQRLTRLHRRLDETPWKLWELPEANRAALGWACETSALLAVSSEDALWLDFDQFLVDPATELANIANHFGYAADAGAIEQAVGGPIMRTYSKAPEHGYSPQLREQVLAQARTQHGPAIAEALKWLDKAAGEHAIIADAMNRAG